MDIVFLLNLHYYQLAQEDELLLIKDIHMKHFFIFATAALLLNFNLALAKPSTSAKDQALSLVINNSNGNLHFVLKNNPPIMLDGDSGSSGGAWDPEQISLTNPQSNSMEIYQLKTKLVSLYIQSFCSGPEQGLSGSLFTTNFQRLDLIPEGTSLEVSLAGIIPNDLLCLQGQIAL